jgi:hypothetical protein
MGFTCGHPSLLLLLRGSTNLESFPLSIASRFR